MNRSAIGELIEKITTWAHRYAEKNGWVLNPEEVERNGILKGLAVNRLKFGKQYCPCRIRSGDPETDKKIICPCTYHRDEIAKDGNCHCRLFFGKDTTTGVSK
ncbi:MAG: ferredoxin-thioredoxin reductase catalytic domain-containing protein [Methanomicrobiales archaeon]